MALQSASADPLLLDAVDPVKASVGTPWPAGWVWVVSGAIAMALYGLTMAPDLLWGDSGEAQLRVLTGSIRGERSLARSHCTYYAVAIAIRRVFGMEASSAANLTTAMAGAVTVANFGALIASIATRRTTIAASVCMLMLSHTLWQMSTGAEVVTFYTMLMTAELFAILKWAQTGRGCFLALALLLNGFAVSTHNFALLFLPVYFVIIVMAMRSGQLRSKWSAASIAAWCVGAAPIIVLCAIEVRQRGSVSYVLNSLLFGRFQDQVFNSSLSWGGVMRVIVMTLYNFPSPLIILCVGGWWWTRNRVPRLFWIYATFAGMLVTMFAIRYDVSDQYTFMVPSYILLVMFAAIGIDQWLSRGRTRLAQVVVIMCACFAPAVYAVTPTIARRYAPSAFGESTASVPNREPFDWFLQPWRNGYHGAHRYAESVFDVLPPDAFLFVLDTMRPPLDYLQGRDGIRLDVYLSYSPYEWAGREMRKVTSANAGRMVREGILFATSSTDGYVAPGMLDARYKFVPVGPVYQIVQDELSEHN